MKTIALAPKEGIVFARLPIPQTLTTGIKGIKNDKGEVVNIITDSNGTPSESAIIDRVNSYYRGSAVMNTVASKTAYWCLPKALEVVSSSTPGFEVGDYWTFTTHAPFNTYIDETKEWAYFELETKFLASKIADKADGENLFDLYREEKIEDLSAVSLKDDILANSDFVKEVNAKGATSTVPQITITQPPIQTV